jgi:hypothetical protein
MLRLKHIEAATHPLLCGNAAVFQACGIFENIGFLKASPYAFAAELMTFKPRNIFTAIQNYTLSCRIRTTQYIQHGTFARAIRAHNAMQ